ncbi:hypothetical protein E4U41_000748 [Claviceps citrina]|nr:hypothetical protein E4U41_000748 [Claviceps citrina]
MLMKADKIILASITAFAAVSYVAVSVVKARRQRQRDGRQVGWVGLWPFLNALGRNRKGQGAYEQALDDNFDGNLHTHPLENTAAASIESSHRQQTLRQTHLERTTQDDSLVDRNTSIRSVMTLPAYRAIAAHNERVIGRAGERGGMDVVVDLPTAEEQESLRDEEMEAIYQIRLARRQQAMEREEARRQIDEARQRGDVTALTEAQSPSRVASNNNIVHELRRDVNRIQERRQRSVSSVSYADLGVARHDGTRIRANSNESERMGLLSDAASFATSTVRDARSPGLHRRERSASSHVSMASDARTVHSASRVWSQSTTPGLLSGEIDAGSYPELAEAGLRAEPLPPPGYENVALDNVEVESAATSLQQPPPEYTTQDATTSPGLERTTPSAESISSSEPEAPSTGEAFPRLPSLRLPTLPIIVVEPEEITT